MMNSEKKERGRPSKRIGDIIKANTKIKARLVTRFSELKLRNKDVCADAKEKGFNIQESALSRYLNNPYPIKGGLTQEQIIWLCTRYCIPFGIVLKKYEKLENYSKLGLPHGTMVPVPDKYDEKQAIENLIKFFGYNPERQKELVNKNKEKEHGK